MDFQIKNEIEDVCLIDFGEPLRLPVVLSRIHAGFPSYCEDYIENHIDLNKELIKHPTATYFARLQGDSMYPLIQDGANLLIDRMLDPRSGDVVVAFVNGDFCVRRYFKKDEQITLVSENDLYAPIRITSADRFEIWGCVTHYIYSFKR